MDMPGLKCKPRPLSITLYYTWRMSASTTGPHLQVDHRQFENQKNSWMLGNYEVHDLAVTAD